MVLLILIDADCLKIAVSDGLQASVDEGNGKG